MIHDTNNYWEQLERLEKLIRASEFKAGVVFSFHSLILGFFVDRFENFELILRESFVFLLLLAAWLISVLISIYFCFRCFRPHMELNYERNVFFFKDAANKFESSEDFSKELIKTCSTEDEIVKRLSEQIHAESVIIEKKFFHVKRATKFFIISFLILIVAVAYKVYFSIN